MSEIVHQSTITVQVGLDAQKIPSDIRWSATDSTAEAMQKARAMMLSFWDPADKAALRIDLWTKDMMVDEMVDFYYQCLIGMADSLGRSTGQQELVEDMKNFARDLFRKFQESQRRQQSAP